MLYPPLTPLYPDDPVLPGAVKAPVPAISLMVKLVMGVPDVGERVPVVPKFQTTSAALTADEKPIPTQTIAIQIEIQLFFIALTLPKKRFLYTPCLIQTTCSSFAQKLGLYCNNIMTHIHLY
jgi:hypothetical protein